MKIGDKIKTLKPMDDVPKGSTGFIASMHEGDIITIHFDKEKYNITPPYESYNNLSVGANFYSIYDVIKIKDITLNDD